MSSRLQGALAGRCVLDGRHYAKIMVKQGPSLCLMCLFMTKIALARAGTMHRSATWS